MWISNPANFYSKLTINFPDLVLLCMGHFATLLASSPYYLCEIVWNLGEMYGAVRNLTLTVKIHTIDFYCGAFS